jgi:hypothetical protein
MKHRLLAVLLVMSLVSASVPVAAAEGQVIGRPSLSLSVPDNRVAPGETVSLDVFVVNDGTVVRGGPGRFVDRVTTARATMLEVGAVRGIDIETESFPFGLVAEGTHGPVLLRLTVPESMPPGTYEVPVELSYTYTGTVTYDEANPNENPEFNDRSVTRRLTVPVVVEQQARFRVVGIDSDVQVGDRGEMVVSVRNVGTESVREASVQLATGNTDLTFGGATTAESFVGEWLPGETKRASFPLSVVKDAERRDYTLTGQVTYTNTDGIAGTSNELRTSVRPLGEQSFSISNVESTLRVNWEGTVTGTVTNEGPMPIYDAVVVFQPTSANFDASDTEYAIPDLAPGEAAEFAFDVEVSSAADPGSRQLAFVVDYENEAGESRTSDAVTSRIKVGPERDPFDVEVADARVPAGGSGRLTLTVTNTEDEALSDISAKLFVDDPISTSDDEAFISELGPGESVEISFSVSSAGSAFPKSYPVSLDFEYDRADGTTLVSETFRLPVDVQESSGGGLPFGIIVGAGAVALVGAAVVVIRRR